MDLHDFIIFPKNNLTARTTRTFVRQERPYRVVKLFTTFDFITICVKIFLKRFLYSLYTLHNWIEIIYCFILKMSISPLISLIHGFAQFTVHGRYMITFDSLGFDRSIYDTFIAMMMIKDTDHKKTCYRLISS